MSFLFSNMNNDVKDKISKSVEHDLYEVLSVHELNDIVVEYCLSCDKFEISLNEYHNPITLTENENYVIFTIPDHLILKRFTWYTFCFHYFWFDQEIFVFTINEKNIDAGFYNIRNLNNIFYDINTKHILYHSADAYFHNNLSIIFFSKKCFS